MKNLALVIHEKDRFDDEISVIGVADSVENAKNLISVYYGEGKHEILSYRDIDAGNLEFEMEISVPNPLGGDYRVWTEWFSINEA